MAYINCKNIIKSEGMKKVTLPYTVEAGVNKIAGVVVCMLACHADTVDNDVITRTAQLKINNTVVLNASLSVKQHLYLGLHKDEKDGIFDVKAGDIITFISSESGNGFNHYSDAYCVVYKM